MTLCPIAAVFSCKKCPAYKICLAKGILGDHKKSRPSFQEKTKKDEIKDRADH